MLWWLSIEMSIARFPRVFVFVCALVVPLTADAAETGGCESFAWPLATELQWLKSPDSEAMMSGAKLSSPPAKAITLTLLPMSEMAFPIAPTGKAKGDAAIAYGGVVSFDGGAEAGLYQVTLASAGWIDVVQDGKTLKPSAHSGKSDCDGIRSVRGVRRLHDPRAARGGVSASLTHSATRERE